MRSNPHKINPWGGGVGFTRVWCYFEIKIKFSFYSHQCCSQITLLVILPVLNRSHLHNAPPLCHLTSLSPPRVTPTLCAIPSPLLPIAQHHHCADLHRLRFDFGFEFFVWINLMIELSGSFIWYLLFFPFSHPTISLFPPICLIIDITFMKRQDNHRVKFSCSSCS